MTLIVIEYSLPVKLVNPPLFTRKKFNHSVLPGVRISKVVVTNIP